MFFAISAVLGATKRRVITPTPPVTEVSLTPYMESGYVEASYVEETYYE